MAIISLIMAFIFGEAIMLLVLCIIAMAKEKKPKNNVHFYVARDKNGDLYLYIGKPVRESSEFLPCRYGKLIKSSRHFSKYGLNEGDYAYLKWEDEPVEVFITLND